jgi:hypothetical protein
MFVSAPKCIMKRLIGFIALISRPIGGSDLISESTKAQSQKALTQSYLRAGYRYNVVLDHLTRYEISLWRQAAQTLLLLQSLNIR